MAEITKIGNFEKTADGVFSMHLFANSTLEASREGLKIKTPSDSPAVSWKTLQALREFTGGQYPLRCVTITGEHDFRGYLGRLSCDRCGKTRRQILGDYLADKEVEESREKTVAEDFAKRKSEIWPAICATPRSQPLSEALTPQPVYNVRDYVTAKASEEFATQCNQDAWNTVLKEATKTRGPCCAKHHTRDLRAKFWQGFLFGMLAVLVIQIAVCYSIGIPHEPAQRQPTRSLDDAVSLGEGVAAVQDR